MALMGFATDVLTLIQAAITARFAGGDVEGYTLPDGTDIKMCSLDTLFRWQEKFAAQAASEAGTSRFRLGRLRPQ
jgi:hypothetical protein